MTAPPDGRLAASARNGAAPDPAHAEAARLRAAHALALELVALPDADAVVARLLHAVRVALAADAASLWTLDGDGLARRAVLGEAQDPPDDDAHVVMAMGALGDDDGPGAVRAVRAPGAPPFRDEDRALLELLAATGAAALANARRLAAADRSSDLALVMEMSREITATLQLDRVLGAAVNIATRMLTFDRGAIALYQDGQCEVRALAGAATVDPDDPALRTLAGRAAFAAGAGERFYLSDREEPGSDAERIFVQLFGEELAADGVAAGLYLPLVDEEGVVGILLFEASRPDFADARRRELATILANQATVAIRNARLYAEVPLAETLGAIGARGRRLMALPRQRRLAALGVAVVALALATLVRWPRRIEGAHPTFRATAFATVRPRVDGVVERVLVREGDRVRRGDPLLQLRDRELRAARDASAADADAADHAAALAGARGDAAAEGLARRRSATLRAETAVLDDRLAGAVVRAPVDGTVLTPRLEERLGAGLAAGDAALLLGRTDTLELELAVDQRDVVDVRPGQAVRLRVDALPQRTFRGRVDVVGRLPADSGDVEGGDAVRFPVRALVPNADGLLRPGMVAYARVLGQPSSALGRLLREPVRRLRLLWWRLLP